jgi:hypothetical protein
MLVSDRPEAFSPRIASKASLKIRSRNSLEIQRRHHADSLRKALEQRRMGNDIGSDGHNHNLNLAITKSLFGFRLLYAFVKIWHCIIQARMPRETTFTFVEAAGFSCDEPLSILFKMTKAELQNALAEATQTDKRTAGVFLDTLGAIRLQSDQKKWRHQPNDWRPLPDGIRHRNSECEY